MTGRLGMVGSSLSRGDKAFGVAMSKSLTPEEIQERIAASQARKVSQPTRAKGHQGKAAAMAAGKPAAPEVKAARKVPLKLLMPTRKQYGNWAVDAALVAGGAGVIHHQRVKKGDDNRRRNAAIGAGAGLAATPTIIGLEAAKEVRDRIAPAKPRAAYNRRSMVARSYHPSIVGDIARDVVAHPRTAIPLLAGMGAIGAGAGYGLTRKRGKKVAKADNRTRNNTIAGAAVGAGGTDLALNVGGWVNRESIKHHERKVDAGVLPHATTRNQRKDILAAHRLKHGVKGDIHDAGNAYYRDFPHGMPAWKRKVAVGYKNHPGAVAGMLAGGTAIGAGIAHHNSVNKAETTMSNAEAHRLSTKYDTKGPLPKGMDRESKMKAYEARYIASGGKKSEKWKHRADQAETGRNIGLAGATAAGAVLLGGKSKRAAKVVSKIPGVRRITPHHVEGVGLAAGVGGGSSELYGEYARKRRASYQNSPGGVAASALSRMRAYTPTKPGAPK